MKRAPAIAVAALTALSLGSCTRQDGSIKERLDKIDKRLTGIESRLGRGAGAARGQGARGQRARRRRGPDPSKVYAVDIQGSPWVGAKDAKVTVVKAFDFACPYCDRNRPTIEKLLDEYQGQIKVVYKNLVVHPQVATAPAKAACAAQHQGKYKEMYELIWEKGFGGYRAERDPSKMSAENMKALAQELGLDMAQYAKDLQGCSAVIAKDRAQMSKLGVSATPGFFINGRYLRGAQPLPRFKALIDEELEKANERIQKRQATASNYYQMFVVGKGKRTI